MSTNNGTTIRTTVKHYCAQCKIEHDMTVVKVVSKDHK